MTNFIPFTCGASASFNPAEGMSEEELASFLRTISQDGLSTADQAEIEDQIEALAPALVELRDAGHIKLNMAVIVEHGKLEGFMALAEDDRLTDLSRRRCRAIRDRLVVQGVKALLGHK